MLDLSVARRGNLCLSSGDTAGSIEPQPIPHKDGLPHYYYIKAKGKRKTENRQIDKRQTGKQKKDKQANRKRQTDKKDQDTMMLPYKHWLAD